MGRIKMRWFELFFNIGYNFFLYTSLINGDDLHET